MVGGDPCDGDVFDGGQGNDNANFFRFTPGVKAEIGGAVSRDGGACTPGDRPLGRGARGIARPRHADRQHSRRLADRQGRRRPALRPRRQRHPLRRAGQRPASIGGPGHDSEHQ